MKQYKLFILLRKLSKPELTKLSKFLKSPFFNENKSLLDLFNYLRKGHPKYSSKKLNKQAIFQKLFPDEIYNARKIEGKMSDLSLLVERFLCAVEIDQDEQLQRKVRIQVFEKKTLFKYLEKELDAAAFELESKPNKDIDDYRELLQTKLLRYAHPDLPKLNSNEPEIKSIVDVLDKFYALSKLKYACEISNRANILQGGEGKLLSAREREKLINCVGEDRLLIDFYCHILDLHREERNDTKFRKLKYGFFQNLSNISKQEQYFILVNLIHYAGKTTNSPDWSDKEEQFDLYKLGFENDIWFINGRIRSITYNNIVTLAAGMKEFDWAENFIERATPMLDDKIKEVAGNMAKAYCQFQQDKFMETKELLSALGNAPFPYNLLIRSLELRTFYEIAQTDNTHYDLLFNRCDNFRKTLKREKVFLETRMAGYKNYLGLIRKLATYKRKGKDLKRHKIKLADELKNKESIIARAWLERKISEL